MKGDLHSLLFFENELRKLDFNFLLVLFFVVNIFEILFK